MSLRVLCCICLYTISFGCFCQTITPQGPISICQGSSVTLTASTGNSYQWQLNGGNIFSATSINYNVTAAGSYRVIITTGAVKDTTAPVVVTVSPNPVADFSFSPNNQCSNVPVQFTSASSGNGLTYKWSFNDPNSGADSTSTVQNPTHRFIGSTGGGTQTFSVKLTVTDNLGCSNSISKTVTTKQPGSQLSGTGMKVYNGLTYFTACSSGPATLTFVNNSSTSGNTNYIIKWGNGAAEYNSSSFTTTTQFYNPGDYRITYVVTGGNGCIDTATYGVYIGTNPAIGLGNPGNTTICTGDSLTFPIDLALAASNPNNTTYTISFNDGTPSVVKAHPPPASITHQFATSSCGINSPNYANSFQAKIVASNPCLTSTGPVEPIYVKQRPEARFTISPRDTICLNTTLTFTSTSIGNNIKNGACFPGNIVWRISPSNGVTRTCGNTGADNGLNDPDLWTDGSDVICYNFTAPGVYTMTLKVGGDGVCGIDSITKTICVNPTPTASFVVDKDTVCVPFVVKTTTTTNTPTCGQYTYKWTTSYVAAAGCVPATSNAVYTQATSASSKEPVFQFNNPGIYTISLQVIAPASSCSSAVISKQVIVKAKPNITALGIPAAICQLATISPSPNANCYMNADTTYLWTFTDGMPNSSTLRNPGTIRYDSAGTFLIQLHATNFCGDTTITHSLTVNPVPDLIIPPDTSYCAGSVSGPFSFITTLSGSAITWTNTNTSIGLAASGSGSINSFTVTNSTANPITSVIKVTVTKNGCSKQLSFTITVYPKPSAPAVTTPVNYCEGDAAVKLTAPFAAGNKLLWYTTSTGGIGDTAAPTPITSMVGTVTHYVSQINSFGCESTRSAIVVNVKPLPVIASSYFTNPITCASQTGTIVLNGLTPSTSFSVKYTKNGGSPVTVTFTSNNSGTLVITNLGSGLYSNVQVSLNFCPSNSVGPFQLSDPNPPPPPTAGNDTTLCSGGTLQLLATPNTSGTITYHWTGPNSFSSNLQNPTVTNITPASSGVYYVTNTVNNCTSLADSMIVVVNSTPARPVITGNAPLCAGDTLKLQAQNFPMAVTYSWNGPNGFLSTAATPFIANATTAASGTYTLTVTSVGGNCTSLPGTLNVVVKPTPNISGTTFTNPINCGSATGSITLNGLSASQPFTVQYTKNNGSPATINITSGASGSLVITNLSAGVYSNISVVLNGCPSNVIGPVTLTDPNPPPPPTAGNDTTLCSGGTLRLLATPNTSGTITYHWTGPNSFSSNLQNPTVTNITTAASGVYYVTNTVNNCTSLADSMIVVVNPTPVRPVITSNAPLCAGDTLKLQAQNFPMAVTYSWNGPNSFSSTAATPFIANAATVASGTYTLTVTSVGGNCTSLPGTLNVVVKPTPNISGTIFTDPVNCGSATGSITLNGLSASQPYTVQYTKNNGSPATINITSGSSGSLVITNLTAGLYSNISVVLNGCPSNVIGPVTLTDPNPPTAPVAGSNGSLCNGDTLRLFANTSITGAFTWIGPNGFTSTQQNPIVNNVTSLNGGKYFVRVTVNNCTSLADSVDVLVTTKPGKPIISSNSPVCFGDTIKLSSTATSPGAVVFNWTGPNSFLSNLPSPFITPATNADAGNYQVRTQLLNCLSDSIAVVSVSIKPTPVIDSSHFADPTSCGSYTGSISLFGFTPSTSYTLYYRFNGGAITSIPVVSNPVGAIILGNLPAGIYSNLSVAFNGCRSAETGPFTLTDLPPLAPSAGNNGPLCAGDTIRLSASVALAGNVSYNWIGPGGFSSTVKNPVIPVSAVSNSGVYSVTATLNGCSASASTTLVISPKAVGGFSGPDSTVCKNTNQGTIQLNGFTGNVVRWQSSGNGGASWTNIANASATLNYNNLATTTWYRAIVVSGVCPPVFSDTTIITVIDKVDSAKAGPDQKLCNQQNANLSANNPVIGTGTWTQTLGPAAVITNSLSPNTSVTGLQPDKIYRFLWTISGAAGCGSSSDEMEIINRPALTQANAGVDTAICDFTVTRSITLHANIDASRLYEKGVWTIISQPNSGNANFANPASPVTGFTFNQPGLYRLLWSISNDAGCSASADTLVINVSAKPIANFSITPNQLCKGESVSVNNASANTNAYLWLWGNGDSSSFVNGSHVYNAAGTFTITLISKKIALTSTCIDSAKRTITVADKIPAVINVAPGKPCVPYTLQVNAVNAAAASSIQWKVFDHNLSPGVFYATGISTSHTYNFAGVDSVRLIVYNTNGCVDSTTLRVKVYTIPTTTFSPSSIVTCNHDTTIIYNASSSNTGNDTLNYLWYVNGQVKGNTNSFNYRFQTPQNSTGPVDYKVQLLAQNNGGCGDTSLSGSVRVQVLPAAGIKVSPSVIQQQPDNTFTFEDTTATNSLKQYLWFMGDRSQQTRSGKNITYLYKDTGTYLVKLITSDFSNGCNNSDSVSVTILYVPGYLQVPNAICPGCSNGNLRSFLPLGKGLSIYRLRILTTWGKVIFETTALNNDGSPKEAWIPTFPAVNGNPLQQDTYRWEIEASFTNGTEWKGMLYPGQLKRTKSGFITVIK